VNARQFTLTVHLTGDGAGTVRSLESRNPLIQCTWNGSAASGTCSAAYPEGQTVSLSAAAETNSTFDHWDEACAGTEGAECSITMNDNKSVTAAFALTSAGSIVGVTRSAVDASAVPAASVELRAGANDTIGDPLLTTVSGSDGSYSFAGLAAGTYTALARAQGYITGVASEIVVTGEAPTTQDIVLSPVLLEGQTRIVLTWGELPEDLDAHLYGPPDGNGFHVWYHDLGSLEAEPFAQLDVDDRHGNGPETITIGQQKSGVYRFMVHDFTDKDVSESAALAGSGAHVQVLQGDRLVAQFAVPQQQGVTWTVFELNGGTITPVNTMSYFDPTVILLSRQASGATKNRSILKATK
jgi:hypothetical protein